MSRSSRGIVFLAWGTPAQKRIDSIGVDKSKHCILRSVHPSPLSAARGFFDCKHFVKANEWLRARYGVEGEVEWDCLADGKQDKGLPSKNEEGKRSVEVASATVKETKPSNGDALIAAKVDVVSGKENAVEDASYFDDKDLDDLVSKLP